MSRCFLHICWKYDFCSWYLHCGSNQRDGMCFSDLRSNNCNSECLASGCNCSEWNNGILSRWKCGVNSDCCFNVCMEYRSNNTSHYGFCIRKLFSYLNKCFGMYKYFSSDSGNGERFTYSNDYSGWSNDILSRWIGDINSESSDKLRME